MIKIVTMGRFTQGHYLFYAIMLTFMVKEGNATVCTADDLCRITCTRLGLGPEAPALNQIIPSNCHGKSIPELVLEYNNIKTIPTNWLEGWTIKFINLGYNPLQDIAEGAFDGHECSVERLFLHGCSQLVSRKNLSKGLFQGLGCSLVRLNLDGTLIQEADLEALVDLKYLDQLHLKRNSLTTIGKGVLNHMNSLTKLFLDDNAINIPYFEAPFEGMARLSEVSLQRNRLQTASYCTFGQNVGLTTLDVDDNPLVCNCTIWWLKAAGYLPDNMVECFASMEGQCSEYALPDCELPSGVPTSRPESGVPTSRPESTPSVSNDESPPRDDNPDANSGMSLSVVIMASVISVLGTAILIAIVFAVCRCRRRGRQSERNPTSHSEGVIALPTSTRNIPTASQQNAMNDALYILAQAVKNKALPNVARSSEGVTITELPDEKQPETPSSEDNASTAGQYEIPIDCPSQGYTPYEQIP